MPEDNAPADQTDPDQQELPIEKPKPDATALQVELDSYKAKFAEIEREKAEQANQRSQAEEESLKERKKYKELFEKREEEAKQLRDKLRKQGEAIYKTVKLQAIKAEAARAGILPEAESDLEFQAFDEVEIATRESGAFDVVGADRAVENLKATRPHWFRTKQAPNINGATPGMPSGKINAADLAKLEKENPEQYKAEITRLMQRGGAIQIK